MVLRSASATTKDTKMTVIAVTSALVGTKLATGADTKIIGITLAQPTPTTDNNTPLTLVDAAAAPTVTSLPGRSVFSASVSTLCAFLFGWKPTWPGTPGLTAPVWPMSLGGNMNAGFTNGLFVQSCPANATFSVTTG